MSENRDLTEPTRDDRVSCLSALAEWLDREGGTARGIRIVRAIVEHDARALAAGTEPAPCEPVQLCGFLAGEQDNQAKAAISEDRAQRDVDPGDLIRNARPAEALATRLPKLEGEWRRRGLGWVPEVRRIIGGGRANPTLYRLVFVPMLTAPTPFEEGVESDFQSQRAVQYDVIPLRAAGPLGLIVPREGFEVSFRSWRALTYAFLVLGAQFAAICLVVIGLVSATLIGQRYYMVIQSAALLLCAAALWRSTLPLFRVVTDRIVQSPIFMLPMDEAFGQLKFVRRRDLKVPRGWLSLVRIRSQCPICESEIELADGKLDFPGRTVGRCREAPAEHVFSFDQTSNRGTWLRQAEGGYAAEIRKLRSETFGPI